MTEKHFEVQCDGWRYFLVVDTINERCIARLDTKGDADAFLEIIKEYEELVQENKGLKYENEMLKDENEQLKKQLSSINQLIDNKIDEFKNGDYGDLPCNTIHMFLDLKQEIGDVE